MIDEGPGAKEQGTQSEEAAAVGSDVVEASRDPGEVAEDGEEEEGGDGEEIAHHEVTVI